MSQVWHFLKLTTAVLTGIAGLVLAIFAPSQLAGYLLLASIAFSVMPE